MPTLATMPARHAAAVAVLLLSLAPLTGCASLAHGWDAALLLADLRAGSGSSMLKRNTAPPTIETITYQGPTGVEQADRYRGADMRRGPLVLVHGFTPEGRRDARLVAFAEALARVGFDVLAPELPGMTDMTVGSTEREQIAAALRMASGDGRRAGLIAMSLAAGPAVQAAMQDELASSVGWILLVGGYHDIADLIRYATTGLEDGGRVESPSQPVREGKWLLLQAQLHQLDDARDREALAAIAQQRLQDEAAPVEHWLARLSAGARSLYELIVNTDPARVDPLIAALPPRLQDELAALDLAQHDLGRLQARLLLVHGAEDPVIPLSQSQRLAAAVTPGQATLFVAPGLSHVDLQPGWRDAFVLWRAAARMLTLAAREN